MTYSDYYYSDVRFCWGFFYCCFVFSRVGFLVTSDKSGVVRIGIGFLDLRNSANSVVIEIRS